MKIIDTGYKFGMETSQIFDPLHPKVVYPLRLSEIEDNLDADLICFGGGEDVHPSVYGHKNVASHVQRNVGLRDLYEIEVFKLARKHNIPMLGICRGAQLLCALSGGALIQDIDQRHGMGDHILDTEDGRRVPMTTTHHQMMWPMVLPKDQFKLIAWITPPKDGNRERRYVYDTAQLKDIKIQIEPEIVHFPATKVLAVQGHPEYFADFNSYPVRYIRELVETYLMR